MTRGLTAGWYGAVSEEQMGRRCGSSVGVAMMGEGRKRTGKFRVLLEVVVGGARSCPCHFSTGRCEF